MNSKRGPSLKKVFFGAKETHPDILRGGHRNLYQLENAIKSGGTVFCLGISLGLDSLPGSCAPYKPQNNVLNIIFGDLD